jgi:hypothetical protein
MSFGGSPAAVMRVGVSISSGMGQAWRALRGRTADQKVGQLARAAESDAVAGRDLVGNDAETFGDHASHERLGEEPVLRAQHEPRRHRRQFVEGPGGVVGRLRLSSLLAHRLLGEGAGHVVIERDERVVVAGEAAVALGLLSNGVAVAGVGPPVGRLLTASRDHGRDQHERIDRPAVGDQRCREAAVRLGDDYEVAPTVDGAYNGVGIVGQRGRVVVARQIGRDGLVSPGTQLLLDEVPVPANVSAAVDERERRHRPRSLPRQGDGGNRLLRAAIDWSHDQRGAGPMNFGPARRLPTT